MYPEPVETWSVTGPFTVSVRSNDFSAANATAGRYIDMATKMPAAALRDGFHRVCMLPSLGSRVQIALVPLASFDTQADRDGSLSAS